MSLSIRRAQLDDLPKIVAIYNETIESRMVTADTAPVTVEERLPWFEAHQDHRPLMVMEENDVIVGWYSFSSFYGRPAYDGTVEVSIYITTDARGKGYGQFAIDQMKKDASTLNISTLLAFIFSHNVPSIQLFKKNNFKVYGELPDVATMDHQLYSLTILGYKVEDNEHVY
ncbi:GNAT family N-acetyltransferase [Macrococcus sp. DPC7161]|uniref:GNAT family N-acetyltransferase n=1 Tax=Macrococcus sp. DPC7161 TaxID=2507060 RepID=UPI00100A3666|nr:GNAT family N-acetyltransferase [Macrococcus sp. DPC7161]RXK17661.1 N-acetyltransferase family protein [Macrococcus sp. DPC7161]